MIKITKGNKKFPKINGYLWGKYVPHQKNSDKCLRQFPDCPEGEVNSNCNKCPFEVKTGKILEEEIKINKLVDEDVILNNYKFKESLIKLRGIKILK